MRTNRWLAGGLVLLCAIFSWSCTDRVADEPVGVARQALVDGGGTIDAPTAPDTGTTLTDMSTEAPGGGGGGNGGGPGSGTMLRPTCGSIADCPAGHVCCFFGATDGHKECADPQTDPDACGGCGIQCGDDENCIGGFCATM